ncbi:MAG: hypothetical protein M3Q24_00575 [bacterium]|nr:hypothetical protein [bacterium]
MINTEHWREESPIEENDITKISRHTHFSPERVYEALQADRSKPFTGTVAEKDIRRTRVKELDDARTLPKVLAHLAGYRNSLRSDLGPLHLAKNPDPQIENYYIWKVACWCRKKSELAL